MANYKIFTEPAAFNNMLLNQLIEIPVPPDDESISPFARRGGDMAFLLSWKDSISFILAFTPSTFCLPKGGSAFAAENSAPNNLALDYARCLILKLKKSYVFHNSSSWSISSFTRRLDELTTALALKELKTIRASQEAWEENSECFDFFSDWKLLLVSDVDKRIDKFPRRLRLCTSVFAGFFFQVRRVFQKGGRLVPAVFLFTDDIHTEQLKIFNFKSANFSCRDWDRGIYMRGVFGEHENFVFYGDVDERSFILIIVSFREKIIYSYNPISEKEDEKSVNDAFELLDMLNQMRPGFFERDEWKSDSFKGPRYDHKLGMEGTMWACMYFAYALATGMDLKVILCKNEMLTFKERVAWLLTGSQSAFHCTLLQDQKRNQEREIVYFSS